MSPGQLEADLCIIGGGAAGITIAREFIGTKHQVILLESGGFEFDAATQDFYQGESVGRDYNLETSRLRYWGGTTNHWSGWCRPLSNADFQERPWFPNSGWPLRLEELTPFYQRAGRVLQLDRISNPLGPLDNKSPGGQVFPFDRRSISTEVYQFSPPTRMGEAYKKEIDQSRNVTTYLHSNVVGIDANETKREVVRVRCSTNEGHRFDVNAKLFVLATGGVENARLLLISQLGNDRDLVGRFFMDHLEPKGGIFAAVRPDDPRWIPFVYGDPRRSSEFEPLCCIALSDAILGREGLVNSALGFVHLPAPSNPSLLARLPLVPGADVQILQVHVYGQHAPDPDSRITLGSELDRLGLPRPKLNWRLNEIDRRSIEQTIRITAQELGRLGLGRMKLDFRNWEPEFQIGYHHMGTTRMSADPSRGVVDAQCKVHGMTNLYVAGSSTFATAGNAPPTLTITALALRLADHIKAEQLG
jgi:choline dehydrogenase-like flavoprotein